VERDHDKDSQMFIEDMDLDMNFGKESADVALCRGSSLVLNSAAAVMLIDWLVDMASVDQQRRVSEAVCQLCVTSSWNAMQCSKAGMITSVVRCLQQSPSCILDMSVVGK